MAKEQEQERTHNRRLHGWEPFDHIEIALVPRFKQSSLSGSTWRVGAVAKFSFKGVVLHEIHFGSMRAALERLSPAIDELCSPISDLHLALDEERCAQPGCKQVAVMRFFLQRLTAPDGTLLDPADVHFQYSRCFCADHVRRGDADREDCESNYTTSAKGEA